MSRKPEFTHTIAISPKSDHTYIDLDQGLVDMFMSQLSKVIGISFFDGTINSSILLAKPWKRIVHLSSSHNGLTREDKEFDIHVPIEKEDNATFNEIYLLFAQSPLASVAVITITKNQIVSSASDGFFLTPY